MPMKTGKPNHRSGVSSISELLCGSCENMEDRLELARAIKRSGNKPGTPWAQAKKELGLDDL